MNDNAYCICCFIDIECIVYVCMRLLITIDIIFVKHYLGLSLTNKRE